MRIPSPKGKTMSKQTDQTPVETAPVEPVETEKKFKFTRKHYAIAAGAVTAAVAAVVVAVKRSNDNDSDDEFNENVTYESIDVTADTAAKS